jgi:hypothetical protein
LPELRALLRAWLASGTIIPLALMLQDAAFISRNEKTRRIVAAFAGTTLII